MNGPQIQKLVDALVDAFPTHDDLRRMVRSALDVSLDRYTNVNTGVEDVAHQLVGWARQKGKLNTLLAGAAKSRPDNETLKALVAEFAGQDIDLGPSGTAADRAWVIPGQDRFALFCDRNDQWEQVKAEAFRQTSELVFVPGSKNQGHEYFIKRIKRQLAIDPKSLVPVGLPDSYFAPRSYAEVLEMLGFALDLGRLTSPDHYSHRIAEELAVRLSARNVVLVHPTVSMKFETEIIDYYTEWLPAILRQARGLGGSLKCLKCYQAVEWRQLPLMHRIKSSMSRMIGMHQTDSMGATPAKDLMTSIEARAAKDVLIVRRVPDLLDITDDDLKDLCQYFGISADEEQQLLRECAVESTSVDKLRMVDTLMPDFKSRKRRLDDEQKLD